MAEVPAMDSALEAEVDRLCEELGKEGKNDEDVMEAPVGFGIL